MTFLRLATRQHGSQPTRFFFFLSGTRRFSGGLGGRKAVCSSLSSFQTRTIFKGNLVQTRVGGVSSLTLWFWRRTRPAGGVPLCCSFSTASETADAVVVPRKKKQEQKRRCGVRNVAIVAHVDHGKTTLVDRLLHLTLEACQDTKRDRLLDSGELEMERGITITSKVTRLSWRENAIFNIVDTPGHADFGGEVDRILSMVDGICLVVDASEGPQAQTKYVLGRALALGKTPLLLLNKVDRAPQLERLQQVECDIMDLFDALDATEEQMNYPTLYASARHGWCTPETQVALQLAQEALPHQKDEEEEEEEETTGTKTQQQTPETKITTTTQQQQDSDMTVLLESILQHVPSPVVNCHNLSPESEEEEEEEEENALVSAEWLTQHEPCFSLAATHVGYDPYLGRTCTGRISSGSIRLGDSVTVLRRQHEAEEEEEEEEETKDGAGKRTKSDAASSVSTCTTITGLFVNRGVSRVELDPPVAAAGDIVTLTGIADSMRVGDTLTSTHHPVTQPLTTPPLVPPTLSCVFGPNTGPLVGQEGNLVTSSKIRARLVAETDNNVTLTVTKSPTDSERSIVHGRGELQLGILIEQMRREGFELSISPPVIVLQEVVSTGKKTQWMEPWEEVTVDVDAEYSGTVMNALSGPPRRGQLVEMTENNFADGKTRLLFQVPTRGLLGLGPELATATRGTAVFHHVFLEHREYQSQDEWSSFKGKLVSNESGKATLYALSSLVERGTLFVEPGDVVYPGMVIGEHSHSTNDLDVNPVRAKQTSNMRTTAKEEGMYLPPAKKRTVEEWIGYMASDEMLEVTPSNLRLRKAQLNASLRQREARSKRKQWQARMNNCSPKK